MVSALSPLAEAAWASGALATGEHALAACSGGADSVALVLALSELARVGRLQVSIAHVHHGLRGAEADREAGAVRALGAALGLPVHERHVDVAAARRARGRGPEEAARALRHAALEQVRVEAGADLTALAHSADDQAETLLLRIVRGTGPPGLVGMRPRSGTVAHPLLRCRRRELREHLALAATPWCSDATNWGADATRSLLRPLLGRLEDRLGPGIVPGLGRLADLLADEHALLEDLARERGPVALRETDGGWSCEATSLAALPPALARRWLRCEIAAVRGGEPPPANAVERVLDLARGDADGLVRGPGFDVRRVGQALRCLPPRSGSRAREPASGAPAG